jgi:Molybdopterin cofactor-binding domain
MMGIGHTLFEEMIYQDGQLLNPGLLDYRIPNMEDLPADLRSILVENADGPGPHGSKGIGESGLMPTAPAIAQRHCPGYRGAPNSAAANPRTRLAGDARRAGTPEGSALSLWLAHRDVMGL